MNLGRRAVYVLGALMLAGCGFHLRGAVVLPAGLSPVYVEEGVSGGEAAAGLRNALRAQGVVLAEAPAQARTVVVLHEERYARRVSAVSETGKARQYRLIFGVSVSVRDGEGRPIVPREALVVERDQTQDDAAVTAMAAEEAQLRREMVDDAVGQLLRRIKALPARSAQ